jgi:uncharacterized protein (DUF924 family)
VLYNWFGELDQTPDYFRERNRLWFGGGPEVDGTIRQRFERDVIRAVAGELSAWGDTPRGSIALIVLLDQFSLNLWREQPRSYTQSELAIPRTHAALERGYEFVLTPAERVFLYLPLEHSERLADQERSVALFEALARRAPAAYAAALESYHDWAVRHWRVVARFGRFPDRNEVFGRPSRPEELEFLASDAAPF